MFVHACDAIDFRYTSRIHFEFSKLKIVYYELRSEFTHRWYIHLVIFFKKKTIFDDDVMDDDFCYCR